TVIARPFLLGPHVGPSELPFSVIRDREGRRPPLCTDIGVPRRPRAAPTHSRLPSPGPTLSPWRPIRSRSAAPPARRTGTARCEPASSPTSPPCATPSAPAPPG